MRIGDKIVTSDVTITIQQDPWVNIEQDDDTIQQDLWVNIEQDDDAILLDTADAIVLRDCLLIAFPLEDSTDEVAVT